MKFFLLVFLLSSLYAKKPDLFLLNNYSDDTNITSWYMSEKLDGVRAYWDGKQLISRNGQVFDAPLFFTNNFPKIELDGELWNKRGNFSSISSIVNTKLTKVDWKELTYNIFEVPNAAGTLLTRLSNVEESQYIKIIQQTKVKDKKHLDAFLKIVEKKGGEGVVVRDGSLNYYVGRNNNALKVKSYIDTECEVLRHSKGNGKYKNVLGSLECKMDNNKVIKIGTGFSDAQRENPPEIGCLYGSVPDSS